METKPTKLTPMFIIVIIALFVLIGLIIGQRSSEEEKELSKFISERFSMLTDEELVSLRYKDQIIRLDVASSPEKKAVGLMMVEDMQENQGMIFIYPQEQYLQFWMKDTYMSLDIIFLDKNLEVINIHHSTKPNQIDERYSSEGNAQYVIELKAGWSESNKLESGKRFELID